jgi:uncharacterized Zn-binding protein involved in type VI secretion
MPGVARVNVDSCVGKVVDPKTNTVFVNNAPISVKGADVQGHGTGSHASPKTDQSSPNVLAYNILVNRQGDNCTCGHPLTGSGNVFAN